MNKIKTILALLLALPITVFGQTMAMSDKPLNILTLGDSNGTFPQSWPHQLELALPNAEIFNISKSGRTIGFINLGDSTLNSLLIIDENLRKAADHTKDKSYDYIIIELGTNDAKAVFADLQQQVPANLGILINKIKQSKYAVINKAKIMIISPPPYGLKAENQEKYKGGTERVKQFSKAFKKVAEQYNCIFVNGFKTPGYNPNSMTADGLHLDAVGSRKLIEPVVAAIINK